MLYCMQLSRYIVADTIRELEKHRLPQASLSSLVCSTREKNSQHGTHPFNSLYRIQIADHPRQAAWYLGNCVANLISGVVVYGIGNITIHTIAQWQLIFLVLGAVTTSLAFWLVALLPDSPKNAIFLKEKERAIALQRTLKNKTGIMDVGTFKWNQVWMAFKDPQTWFLVLYNFCVNLCNGGITSVCPAI